MQAFSSHVFPDFKKVATATFLALALAACGGGGSDDTATPTPDPTPQPSDDPGEKGCLDECKKFLSHLVDDFATTAATAKSTKATDANLDIFVEGDTVTFNVASVGMSDANPGELSQAFPVSNNALSYTLTVNKTTGEITVDNKAGKTYTVKAFDEATYFQDIDYGTTDLADKNKAHYAYLAFNAKEKANAISKDANLRRQWKQASGDAYPSPGVSIMLNTPYEDCPGKQDICDIVMLSANPEMHPKPTEPDGPAPNAAQISGSVNGVQQSGNVDVSGTWIVNGAGGNHLTAKTAGTPPNVWSIQHLKAAVGKYTCGNDEVAIAFTDAAGMAGDPMNAGKYQATSAHKEASCTVEVLKADETVMEGVFTATLVGLSPTGPAPKFDVKWGSFSVPKK